MIRLVEAGNEIRQRRLEAGFACDVGRAGGHRGIAQGQAGGSGRSMQSRKEPVHLLHSTRAHHCGCSDCVSFAHLYLGTNMWNVLDRMDDRQFVYLGILCILDNVYLGEHRLSSV